MSKIFVFAASFSEPVTYTVRPSVHGTLRAAADAMYRVPTMRKLTIERFFTNYRTNFYRLSNLFFAIAVPIILSSRSIFHKL